MSVAVLANESVEKSETMWGHTSVVSLLEPPSVISLLERSWAVG